MTASPGFVLHPGAAQDILEIWEYVANDSLVAAARFREEILEAIRKVAEYPNAGHTRPDITADSLRFQVVRDYLIVYVPDLRPVPVLAVIHGYRNPRVIAGILRGRGR